MHVITKNSEIVVHKDHSTGRFFISVQPGEVKTDFLSKFGGVVTHRNNKYELDPIYEPALMEFLEGTFDLIARRGG